MTVVTMLAAGVLVGRNLHRQVSGVSPDEPTGKASTEKLTRYRIPVTDSQPSQGPSDALVTIIEWSALGDAESQHASEVIAKVLQRYPRDVRLVFRNYPANARPEAMAPAELAMEANDQAGKFWQAEKLLSQTQGPLTDADYERLAGQLQLDVDAFRKSMAGHTHAAHIVADRIFADMFGAHAPPSVFVNGAPLGGQVELNTLTAAVERELISARQLVAHGVARESVYEAITKNAAPSVEGWKLAAVTAP